MNQYHIAALLVIHLRQAIKEVDYSLSGNPIGDDWILLMKRKLRLTETFIHNKQLLIKGR